MAAIVVMEILSHQCTFRCRVPGESCLQCIFYLFFSWKCNFIWKTDQYTNGGYLDLDSQLICSPNLMQWLYHTVYLLDSHLLCLPRPALPETAKHRRPSGSHWKYCPSKASKNKKESWCSKRFPLSLWRRASEATQFISSCSQWQRSMGAEERLNRGEGRNFSLNPSYSAGHQLSQHRGTNLPSSPDTQSLLQK